MKKIDREIVEGLRFSEDLKLFKQLTKNRKITKLAKGVIKEDADHRSEETFMRTGLRVTKEISPKYFKLFKKAQDCLGFDEKQIIPYIQQDSRINAACIHETEDKYLIYLTSSLIEHMTETQILFVIGHELGHAFYKHHQLPIHGIMNSIDPPKANDVLLLLKWSRMAEISADRAGLLCARNLEAALASMLVLSSGLPSSLLNVDIDAYGKQSEEMIPNLVKNKTLDDLYSTHPFNPLRVISLKLFWESKELHDLLKIGNNNKNLEEISFQIRKIFSLMDGSKENFDLEPNENKIEESNKENKNITFIRNADEILFWSCVLVASVSSNISEEEVESIKSIIDDDEIEVELNRLKLSKNPFELAEKKFNQVVKNLNDISQQERCSMLQKLIIVSRADGVIDSLERDIIQKTCTKLDIPKNFSSKIIDYL